MEDIISKFGQPLIFIDDGSHRWDDQINTFENMFTKLKPGGFYVIEDIDTSFLGQLKEAPFQGSSSISTFEYIYKLSRVLCADDRLGEELPYNNFIKDIAPWVGTIEIARRTVIISKKNESGFGPR